MRADQEPVNQRNGNPSTATRRSQHEQRCKRCQKLLDHPERETYYTRTGMCFWCAYVDSQG